MVLEQDRAQTVQASNIAAEREAARKAEQSKKAQERTAKERKAIEDEYDSRIARQERRGKRVMSPTAKKAHDKQLAQLKSGKQSALVSFDARQRGIEIKSYGMSRTVADIRRGKIHTPVDQLTPALQKQYYQAELNAALYSGKITLDQYAQATAPVERVKTPISLTPRERRMREISDRKTSQQRSAGLRKAGNVQIASSQRAELARLKGGLSPNIGKSNSRVSYLVKPGVAGTTAALAQPWGDAFKIKNTPLKDESLSIQERNLAAVISPPTTPKENPYRLTAAEKARSRTSPLISKTPQVQGPPRPGYAVTVDGKQRVFKTEESALKFLDRTAKPVITPIGMSALIPQKVPAETKTVPPSRYSDFKFLEPVAQHIEDRAILNKRLAEKNPSDVFLQVADAGSSMQASLFTTAVKARDLVQKNLLGREITPKKQLTITPTYYDKGIERATETIKFQKEAPYITGVPTLNPLEKGNIFQRGFEGTKEQASKQSTARNIGQTIVAAPIIALDAITLGRGGLAVAKPIIRVGGQSAAKVAAPRLVRTVLSAPGRPVTKVPAVIAPRKPASISGTTLYDQLSTRQASITGRPTIKPNVNVRPDPGFKPGRSPGEVKASARTGIIPKENISGRIEFSKGFIPSKPKVTGKKPSTVQSDPSYRPTRRPNEIAIDSNMSAAFRSTRISFSALGETRRLRGAKPPTRIRSRTVEADPYYKPSRRSNEITLDSDVSAAFSSSRIRLGSGVARTSKFKDNLKSIGVKGNLPSFGSRRIARRKPIVSDKDRFKPRTFTEPKGLSQKSGTLSLIVKQKQKKKTLTSSALLTTIKARQQRITGNPTLRQRSAQVVKTRLATPKQKKVYARAATVGVGVQGVRAITSQKASAQTTTNQRTGNANAARERQSVVTVPRSATPQRSRQSSLVGTALASSSGQPKGTGTRPALRTFPKARPAQRSVVATSGRPSPRAVAAAPPLPGVREGKKKKSKKGRKDQDFLGNVQLGNIQGFIKRQDIIVGSSKKISKQITKDRQVSRKNKFRV